MTKMPKTIRGISVSMGLLGLAMIAYECGWIASIGLFIFTWGNNIGIGEHLNDKIRRILLR